MTGGKNTPTPGTQTAPVSKKMLWAGRIMSALPVLMLLFSGVMKLMKPVPVVEGFVHLRYPESLPLGAPIGRRRADISAPILRHRNFFRTRIN